MNEWEGSVELVITRCEEDGIVECKIERVSASEGARGIIIRTWMMDMSS